MCGISGFNWSDGEKIRDMVAVLSHRGPDADGIYLDSHVSLGHNRLSIIDLSASANQPMLDLSEELVIVFNGEIYNFQEIKDQLESEYEFKTKSDTEVILAGYRKWGRSVVEKLNGMFAFAIWDKHNQELFCARDHAGIKPLYYFWDEEKFIFASELKGIFAHDVSRHLDKEAFNNYLRVLYVPEPRTLVKNIFKLPPSSTLLLKNKKLVIEKYGKYSQTKSDIPYSEAVEVMKDKVIEAVGRQLVADVPVGVYLSGGIDSSSILYSMTNFKKDIKTFSVGFELNEEEEREKFNHDFELARKTAQFFNTDHHSLMVSSKDALNIFEKSVNQNDDLISNPTSLPMMLLAEFAKKQVDVVLTGNGGDEFFGGYERYRTALVSKYYKKIPKFARNLANLNKKLHKLDYKSEVDFFAQFMFQKDDKLSRVVSSEFFERDVYSKEYFNDRYLSRFSGDVVDILMQADQESWLPDQAFGLSDRMSMSSALEERVPLADKEIIEFSRSLPREYKVDLFRTKKILKDAFKEDLPEFLFNQPKRGWFSPAAKWLRHRNFQLFAREVLSEHYYQGTVDLFNWSEVGEVLENHISRKEYNLTLIWVIICFQIWAKHYQIKI